MSRTMFRPLLAIAIASLTLVAATGCGSTQKTAMDRRDKTAASIEVVQNEVTVAQEQMNAAAEALQQVYTGGGSSSDLLKFTKELDSMTAAASKVRSRFDSIRSGTETYFKKWERDLDGVSDELKALAEVRRGGLRDALERVSAELEATAAAFTPVRTRMEDLSIFLANDLTPSGLSASTDLKNAAIRDVGQVNQRVESLRGEIQTLRDRFAG